MSDKKLQITADLKIKTTDAERELKKLSKEGVAISKVLKGLDISTNNGRAGFAKSITTASKEMLKLKGVTADTGKVMEGVYGRQLERHSKNIDKYTKQIDNLHKKLRTQQYNVAFQTEGGNIAGAEKYSGAANRTADRIVIAEAARQATQAAMRELKGETSGATVNYDKVRNALGVAQGFMGGASQALGTYQSGKTMAATNLAATRDFERSLLSRMAGGDFSDSYYAMRHMQSGKDALRYARDQAGGTWAGSGQNALGAMSGAAQAIGSVLPMGGGAGGANGISGSVMNSQAAAGGLGSGVNGVFNSFQNQWNGGANVMAARAQAGELEAQKAQDPMGNAALQFLQGTAGMRVGASKALQGRHMGAWGTGMGYGLDMGESFGKAGALARAFGVSATMNSRGGRAGTAGRTEEAWGDVAFEGALPDQTGGSLSGGTAAPGTQWTGPSSYKQKYMKNIPGTPGTAGHSLFSRALGMESMGMDFGTAGTALGTVAQANGNNSESAYAKLEDVMTKAFGRGLTDARLGEEIVKATAELTFGSQGGRDSRQLGMSLSYGIENNNLRQAQMNVQGMQVADQQFTQNPYFQAVSATAARKALGSTGSYSQMMLLSRASMSDLVGSGSDALRDAGITPDQIAEARSSRVNGLMTTYTSTHANDKSMSSLMAAYHENGNDWEKVLHDKRNAFGGFNKQMGLQVGGVGGFGTYEQATGLFNDVTGFNSQADSGSGRQGYQNKTDGAAASEVMATQKVLNELYQKEITMHKDLLVALSTASAQAAMVNQGVKADFSSTEAALDSWQSILDAARANSSLQSHNPTSTKGGLKP